MGGTRSFKRARMVPNPLGNPAVVFKPYSFGQMKPLPFIHQLITLSQVMQTYGKIFIPKNSWGINKILFIEFGVEIFSHLPNTLPQPSYTEGYFIPGCTQQDRMPAQTQPPPPQSCWAWLQRTFVWDGSHIYEVLAFDSLLYNSAANGDDADHRFKFLGTIAPFDPTVDNYLELQMKTTFLASTDTINIFTGQAFIQSPLDLRRLSS
jgi:hypothetical protein